MYYNARYYDPTLGLFIQADSVDDGLNKYQYVANCQVPNLLNSLSSEKLNTFDSHNFL